MDPIAFYVFGFPVRWYALAYIFGILGGGFIAKKFAKSIGNFEENLIDIFINYAVIGIVVGGRLGHVIFYEPEYFYSNPIEIIQVWHGGMSFHGGFIGILVSTYLFCKKYKIKFLRFCDVLAIASPLGLFLGRISNFINGELIGKESNTFLAINSVDNVSRHPAQLYEAFFEGIILLFIMLALSIFGWGREKPGRLAGFFCVWYSASRIICEFFKEPDTHFNYLVINAIGITLGQLLSIPLLITGIYLVFNNSLRKF